MDQVRKFLYISNMTTQSPIQSYSLFGETSELVDALHVESIQSRSQKHNWELKPHRHARLHQVLFITGGGGAAELDGRNLALPPPCIVNVPRGVVHGFIFDPGTAGWVISLTSDLVDHCLATGEGVRIPVEFPCILAMPSDLQILAERIHVEYHSQGFARAQVLRGLAMVLTALVARSIQQTQGIGENSRSNPVFTRFQALVERDFRLRRSLADYANELAVSPTHLNRIVHQATGQAASQLVNERVLREARRLLIYTNLTAASIAYELGFGDPAHFSRVFTKGTGVPPRLFRKRLEQAE